MPPSLTGNIQNTKLCLTNPSKRDCFWIIINVDKALCQNDARKSELRFPDEIEKVIHTCIYMFVCVRFRIYREAYYAIQIKHLY